MDCAEARVLLSRRLDGEPLAAGGQLDRHLAGCSACQILADRLASDDTLLTELWPAVAAPSDFAERLVVRLPRRRPARGRRLALAAAVALLLLLAATLAEPTARASVGLFLRQVVLRESAPPEALGLRPLAQVSLEEAQRLAGWPIRQPASLPEGYRLVGVYAGEVHAFASGPTIVLHYQQGEGSAARHLGITELRATADVDEPIEPGAARQIPVGTGTGLFIDGRWIERDGQRLWERGRLLRLIVEQAGLVIQLEADPDDGWDADRLAEVAVSLRE